ncbi:acyl-CoA dehydrogenase family protein [Leptospira sp. GIMC2001]|uniref:acyl-CoA dehydrogenase family protein n=1 Tax=Leptospira sp. GIMC2001 TaxID=1513297 RepID=UPI00234B69D8|nr:acyl-CoA dehydrogenase family protein [Leptospira sp. GIMC2001]WCL49641.1 acyl-CoA/acyl-ACP dehydrogenase [Leptospira sp. GIMC2001]
MDDWKEFIDSFRKFLEREVEPFAHEWDEKGELPRVIFKKLSDIGYFGLVAPEEYGGSNLGIIPSVQAMELLSEFCGSTFFSASASFGLFGEPLKHFGSDIQKNEYYRPVLSGEKIGCMAITEPQSGSDVSSIKTIAKQKKDLSIELSGQKTYITNSSIADYAIVLARFINSEGIDKGLTHFIVNLDNPRIQRGRPMKKLGLRASVTGELFFDQAVIGNEENILGGIGKGFRQTMATFNEERLSIAAYSLGVLNACLKECISFASSRMSFGKPIYQHQAVAHMIADLYTKVESVRSFTYRIANEMQTDQEKERKDRDSEMGAKCSALKLFASTQAREGVNLAVQIHGGAGYMEEYKVARLYRDIRLAEIGGGTSEIQKSIIAGSIMKRSKK